MVQKNELFVVGIGASVGGLDAIKQLFENVTNNTGMAFVIIQHLSTEYKSLMPELLSKHTKMNIYTAEQGQTLKPNCIYLNQSGKNLEIKNQKFQIVDFDEKTNINYPIDIFLQTLGNEYHDKSICVILSGTGSDGVKGIKTIKEVGGTIIVQEPTSAQFNGMPNAAISTNMVDFILDPKQIAALLPKLNRSHIDFIENESQIEESGSNEELFTKILGEIHKSTGIDFKDYKRNTIVRRLEKRLHINGLENLQEYYAYLKNTPEEKGMLMHDFLIGVTSFFRDIEAFNVFKEKVIPQICQNKAENEVIRIWIPGCSTGEEVFTIAILFYDHIANNNLTIDFKIFATDVDSNAINKASSGYFHTNIANEIDKEYLEKYFVNMGSEMEISRQIREKIVFSSHNILKDPPFIRMDLISCRNLLIYLNNKIQKKVLSNFLFGLNKFGYLFLGNSESIGDIKKHFEQVDTKWKIYKNISDSKPLATQHSFINKISNITTQIPNKKLETTEFKTKENPESVFHRYLSNKYSPSCIFIDKNFNILFIKGDAGKKLIHSEGLFERDLLKVVDSELASVIRNGINRLDSEKKEVVYRDVFHEKDNNQFAYNISFYHPENNELQETYVIEFSEDRKIEDSDKIILENIQIDDYSKQRIAYLEDELKSVKNELQNVIEELETSNEELQSSNEELMSSNEELQGTNEELQSANEELYTVNNEFLEKNKELNDLNNDINNLFNSTDIGTLFLDNELRIRKYTPSLQKHFKLQETDIGRPITSFASNFNEAIRESIIIDSEKVLKELITIEKEITDNDNNNYLKRISPFITSDKKIDGVVITFVDITLLRKTETQLLKIEAKYKNLFDNLNEGFLHCKIIVDENGAPIDWVYLDVNFAFAKYVGLEVNQILGHKATELFPETTPANSDIFRYFGKTAITGEEQYIQDYKGPSGNAFIMHVFCPEKGQFAATFTDITPLKKAEEELFNTNRRLKLANTVSEAAIWEMNFNTNQMITTNKIWEELYGIDNENVSVQWEQNIHEDDKEKTWQSVKDHFEGKTEKYHHEFRYRNPKTGEERWISDVGKVVEYNADGSPARVLGVSIDISNRKKAELELIRAKKRIEESEQKFKIIATSTPDHIIVQDQDLKYTMVINPQLGLTEKDMIGKTDFEFLNHDDAIKLTEIKKKVMQSGETTKLDTSIVNKNGELEYFSGSFVPKYNENCQIDGLVGYFTNVTEKVKIEKELLEAKNIAEQNEKKYKSLFTALQEGVYLHEIIYNEQGKAIDYRIIEANPISERYLNIKLKDAVGKLATELYGTPEAPFLDIYAKVAETGEPYTFSQYFEPMDKHFFISVFSPQKGQFATAFLDITENKNFEIALLKAKEKAEESDRFKTAFLQNISHEIRTPLNAIMGFSDLLNKNFNNKEKLDSFSSIIVKRSKDLLDIINDIIDISKIESEKLPKNIEVCNLNDLFGELFEIISEYQKNLEKSQIELKIDIVERTLTNIKVDKGKLKQILVNLLTNAIKYTTKGFVQFGYKIENEQLVFFVFDSGVGIANDKFDQIFERFVRLKQTNKGNIGGTGLGLSIVKGLVNLLGGKIWIESEPGKGSKFYFTISYEPADIQIKNEAQKPFIDKISQVDNTILIVEDDLWNAEYIKEVLSKISENIFMAETGQLAIETVKNNKIDIVLLDIRLPDMTGYDVLLEIKKISPKTKIIIQTAYVSHEEKQKAREYGCVDYIAKPIKEQILIESLYNQL